MTRPIFIVSIICIFTGILSAQEQRVSNDRVIPEQRRRALVLDINARVLENEPSTGPQGGSSRTQAVVWHETHQKITIPGTPVGIQLVGANLVVAAQFTPFIRRHGSVLFAQVQIGIKDADHGVSYYTSIQTIPMEFGEPIYFLPLGQSGGASSIEIILTVNPYRETAVPESTINTANDK
jgi:hypothetical protein